MKGDVDVAVTTPAVSVQAVTSQKKKSLTPLAEKAAAGSTMQQKVLGELVTFKLVEIPAKNVQNATMVYLGNERDQFLLDAYAVADMISSFRENGQLKPAYGRDTCGVTEIADGSRRRFTAMETNQPLFVWVGDLNDKQMQYLSDVGNQYAPTSAWEKGKRFAKMLENASQEEVAKVAGLRDRKGLMRYVATASLPIQLIKGLQSPSDMTARKGETLSKVWAGLDAGKQEEVIRFLESWIIPSKAKMTSDEVIDEFIKKCGTGSPEKKKPEVQTLPMGASMVTKGGTTQFHLPKEVSDESRKAIEAFISQVLSKEALDNC